MEIERIKKYLEKQREDEDEDEEEEDEFKIDKPPYKFFDPFIISGIHRDLIETGRVLCSFQIPPRLLNKENNALHVGVIASMVDLVGSAVIAGLGHLTTGVSVEINVSCVDAVITGSPDANLSSIEKIVGTFTLTDAALANEEIEIEAKEVRVGKSIAVVIVELRNKATGKIIAQGRHTKYLPVISKL